MRGRKRKIPDDFVPQQVSSSDDEQPPLHRPRLLPVQVGNNDISQTHVWQGAQDEQVHVSDSDMDLEPEPPYFSDVEDSFDVEVEPLYWSDLENDRHGGNGVLQGEEDRHGGDGVLRGEEDRHGGEDVLDADEDNRDVHVDDVPQYIHADDDDDDDDDDDPDDYDGPEGKIIIFETYFSNYK